MKILRCFLMAVIFAAFSLTAAPNAARFNPKPVSPRYVKVGAVPAHTLAEGGKACCEVVIPAKANPSEKYAAKELAGFLEKIIGAKVPIRNRPSGKATAATCR